MNAIVGRKGRTMARVAPQRVVRISEDEFLLELRKYQAMLQYIDTGAVVDPPPTDEVMISVFGVDENRHFAYIDTVISERDGIKSVMLIDMERTSLIYVVDRKLPDRATMYTIETDEGDPEDYFVDLEINLIARQ